jgi:hypothetical protein
MEAMSMLRESAGTNGVTIIDSGVKYEVLVLSVIIDMILIGQKYRIYVGNDYAGISRHFSVCLGVL